MTLRQQFEKEYKWVNKKEQPMFLSIKYIHWLEDKIKKLEKANYKLKKQTGHKPG